MKYELIISEKPKTAMKIAAALANGTPIKESEHGVPYYKITHGKKDIVVCSAVGHVYALAEKNKGKWTYPVFDIEWKEAHQVSKGAAFSKKYVQTIKTLCKNADDVVVATDYDIEGEVIGLNVVRYACKRKDAARMKFSTLTKPDLIKSYDKRSNTLDWGQAEAGETRHMLDWYYGINISRALTSAIKKGGIFKVLSSGRVQGPALKILADKEKTIAKFISKPYWEIVLKGLVSDGSITAMHKEGKIFDKEKSAAIVNKTKGKDAFISNVKRKRFKQEPPYPFDLTSLQTEAYKTLKISPTQTLAIAQTLYTDGMISYPRTSSQKLPTEIGYEKIIKALAKNDDYALHCVELLKGKLKPHEGPKSDQAHPAIYPTGVSPRNIEGREKNIYDLITRRFLATFGTPAVRETLKISIAVNDETFAASGTTTIEPGWHKMYGRFVMLKEEELPHVNEGDKVNVESIEAVQKETQPPKRYTPASIIRELEKHNLGTKATRASIIERLRDRGYVRGDSLMVTELGMQAIETLEKYCPKMIDEKLTRHFEDDMEQIREGKKNKEEVLKEARDVLKRILSDFRKKETSIGTELRKANVEARRVERIVGKCPKCSDGELRIITSKTTKKRFLACNKYPECKTTFALPQRGMIKTLRKVCVECGHPVITVISKGKRPWKLCINPECPGKKDFNINYVKKDEQKKNEQKKDEQKT